MSNQEENENQQTEIMTPEEVRQSLLAEIDATRQAIAELSDEELADVSGAGLSTAALRTTFNWLHPKPKPGEYTVTRAAPNSPMARDVQPTSASIRRTNSAPVDSTRPETHNQLLRNNSWDWKPDWKEW